MIEKNSKKTNISGKFLMVLISLLFVFSIFCQTTCVFATTALPTLSTQIPTSPTNSAAVTPTPSPTVSKEPEFLQDFTVPPLQSTENPNASSNPDKTAKPDSAGATIGIVEVDNIEAKKPFMWSDLIKYLAYAFFALAIVAVLYGLISMAVLIFFKKDITLAGIRKHKEEKKKKNKK